jgi:hypothetical protein
MNENTGTKTWCSKCKDFFSCEVTTSSANGIYKSSDVGYRIRERFCNNCKSHFNTIEVDAKYFRKLKWESQLTKQELEYAKLSREKIRELVENLIDYYKKDNDFWSERDSLFGEIDNASFKPRRFPTKSELEALKASAVRLREQEDTDSEPQLRLVENLESDQLND